MSLVIPQPWLEVYQRVKAVAPEAILAGGCLRDLDNGRPVKDLDIFVEPRFGYHRLFPDQLIDTHVISRWAGEQYFEWDATVTDVGTFPAIVTDLPEVNLIVVHDCTVEAQMERFDFGICRIMFDGELHKHYSYDRDKERQTFTLMRNGTPEQRKHSLQRYERLQGKYPGWKLVEPHGVPEENKGDVYLTWF